MVENNFKVVVDNLEFLASHMIKIGLFPLS